MGWGGAGGRIVAAEGLTNKNDLSLILKNSGQDIYQQEQGTTKTWLKKGLRGFCSEM